MLVLSIDCAGFGCGVCVWRDGAVLDSAFENMERGQDQKLMPLVMRIMQEARITFDNLDRVAVTRGPGSFTGLRIGLAAARGIGLAAGKPVIGIDRFAIYHEALKGSGDQLIVINSRRDELYCRFYPANAAAQPDRMMTADEIKEFLIGKMNAVVAGDVSGFAAYQPITEAEHVIAARLAASADPQKPEHAPRPLYIRAPDVTMPKAPMAETLRPLTLGEALLLAELHAESFGAAKWNQHQIESSLALDTTRGWGIFDEGEMAGFILCQIVPGQSEILTFCVRPAQRRRGLGDKLMHAAAEAARAANGVLYLEVAADNTAAIALYGKAGFKQTGARPKYYKRGAESVDAVLMTLE